jgi:hypothetical protein
MPLEIGMGRSVEKIDSTSDKVLKIGQLPLHNEANTAQKLAAHSKRGVVCFRWKTSAVWQAFYFATAWPIFPIFGPGGGGRPNNLGI